MSIHSKLAGPAVWALAFSVQDVDRVYEYEMALRRLATELAELENLEVASQVNEYEDESGHYVVVDFNDSRLTLNYIDLFIDMMNDPEMELDLEHLQLLTYDSIAYQRFANAKEERLRNSLYDLIEDLNESNIPDRLVAIEQVILYNHLDKMKPIVQAIVKKLELNGIEVGDAVNEVAKHTLH